MTGPPPLPSGGYGYPVPPVLRAPSVPRAVVRPDAEYQQVLRGPLHRWWRPLVSIALVVLFTIALGILLLLGTVLGGALTGQADPMIWVDRMLEDLSDPVSFLVLNLSLVILIPVVLLATWLAHGVRPGFVSSVAGRFRWGWFGRCVAVLLPVWLAYLGVSFWLSGETPGARPREWGALALVTLLTTPLQAAGEEYAFRGWLLQSIGSWFANRWAALVVPLVLSVACFAWAHGSPDVWIVADLCIFAVAAGLLTWRTGGLEAAVAVHAVNNVVGIGASLLLGGFEEGFIDAGTSGSPGAVVVSLVVQGIAVALIWRLADRADLQRRTPVSTPPAAPA